ncbi:MAG: hypothetical protein U9R42_03930 [Bacteroidota bacterium]|nr:hypothetical protein [Bacteroidota bacterium]
MFKKIFILLVFSLFLFSCEEDFQVNSEWKDITIVYGMLNPNESNNIHYIKIGKAFTNEGMIADSIASNNPDSLYYMDSLFVVLEEWKNGNHKSDIILFKEYNENKSVYGDFYAPGQHLYRTPSGTELDKNSIYKLKITNTKTGKAISSQTDIVGNMIQIRPMGLIHFDTANKTKIKWFPGENAYFYNIDLKFTYLEYKKNNPSKKDTVELIWSLASYLKTPSQTSIEMEISVNGKKFFEFIADNIEADVSIERKLPRNNIELLFSAGGKEIYYYIYVNRPSVGIVQKKPEYTNIENGLGVFSSRNLNNYSTELSSLAKNYLFNSSQTIDLNFID